MAVMVRRYRVEKTYLEAGRKPWKVEVIRYADDCRHSSIGAFLFDVEDEAIEWAQVVLAGTPLFKPSTPMTVEQRLTQLEEFAQRIGDSGRFG
jgi:hypothetical protein